MGHVLKGGSESETRNSPNYFFFLSFIAGSLRNIQLSPVSRDGTDCDAKHTLDVSTTAPALVSNTTANTTLKQARNIAQTGKEILGAPCLGLIGRVGLGLFALLCLGVPQAFVFVLPKISCRHALSIRVFATRGGFF